MGALGTPEHVESPVVFAQDFQSVAQKPELDRVVLFEVGLLGQPDEWCGVASGKRFVQGIAPGVGVGGAAPRPEDFERSAQPAASPGEVRPRRTRAQASSAPAAARVIPLGRAAKRLPIATGSIVGETRSSPAARKASA